MKILLYGIYFAPELTAPPHYPAWAVSPGTAVVFVFCGNGAGRADWVAEGKRVRCGIDVTQSRFS